MQVSGAQQPAAVEQSIGDSSARTTVTGQETPPVARAIIETMLSPFCPGLLLSSCPSPQADSLRRAIVGRAAAGESRSHIENDLIATYGDRIRAAPAADGFGLVAWVTPFVLLVLGGLLVRGWIARARRRASASPRTGAASGSATERAQSDADGATAAEQARLAELMRKG